MMFCPDVQHLWCQCRLSHVCRYSRVNVSGFFYMRKHRERLQYWILNATFYVWHISSLNHMRTLLPLINNFSRARYKRSCMLIQRYMNTSITSFGCLDKKYILFLNKKSSSQLHAVVLLNGRFLWTSGSLFDCESMIQLVAPESRSCCHDDVYPKYQHLGFPCPFGTYPERRAII